MIRTQLQALKHFWKNRTWLEKKPPAKSSTLWTCYRSIWMWRIREDGQGCHHLPPTSTNCKLDPHPAMLDQPRPHACIDNRYSSIPRRAPTIRINRHCTRANIWILEPYGGTRFTHVNINGIWYKYKLSKRRTSGTTVYEPRIHKDKEDNSIKVIRILQREVSSHTELS